MNSCKLRTSFASAKPERKQNTIKFGLDLDGENYISPLFHDWQPKAGLARKSDIVNSWFKSMNALHYMKLDIFISTREIKKLI